MKKTFTLICSVILSCLLASGVSAALITMDLQQNATGGYGAGSLTYSDIGTSFAGSLTVSGLTSGMTYQMKLEGLNNTDLGSIGRWWVVDPTDPSGWGGRNATDANYQSEMDAGYDVLGYLLFDSFEYSGSPMTIDFYVDSSYHTAGVPQTGRPAPGDVVMPSGMYSDITFLITEDSAPWATPLLAEEISFNTSTEPVPEPSTILLMGFGLLGVVTYSRKRLFTN